jgi:hypothetical protein
MISPVAAEPLSVSLTDSTVQVDSTPRSTVAVVGVAQEPANYLWRIASRRELLLDDDGDARLAYTPPHGVAFRSIWIAVDVASGASAMAVPPGFIAEEMHELAVGSGKAVETVAKTLDISRGRVEILLVRPGAGAWSLSAREGGPDDRDGTPNNRLRVHLQRLLPLRLDYGAAPDALREGDVVVVLDANRMQYWSRTISAEDVR